MAYDLKWGPVTWNLDPFPRTDPVVKREERDVIIKIRQNSTGRVVEYKDKLDWEPHWRDVDGYNYFWWEDGNGSCDCNRRSLFYAQLDEFPEQEAPCTEDLYSVNIYMLDGKPIMEEFDK